MFLFFFQKTNNNIRLTLIISSFGVILLLTIVLNFIFSPYRIVNSSISSVKQLTAEECKPLIKKYNNKVLRISEKNAMGSIGIKVGADCNYTARYILTFSGDLPQNPIPNIAISGLYNYVANLHKTTETTRGNFSVGVVNPVRQNATTLPGAFIDSSDVSKHYRSSTGNSSSIASSFYWTYEKHGNFSQDIYQDLIDNNVFEIIDGLPYIVTNAVSGGVNSYKIDQERAMKERNIIRKINLTISE